MRSGELPPLPSLSPSQQRPDLELSTSPSPQRSTHELSPAHPEGNNLMLMAADSATMTHRPNTHEPLDWVVAEGLHVPTHPPDRCRPCETWANHIHYSMHESSERFEIVRAEASINIRSDITRVYEERLEAAILDIRSSLARVYEERLEASGAFNQSILRELAEKKAEVLQYKARNELLEQSLGAAASNIDDLEEQVRRATDELHLAASNVNELKERVRRATDESRVLQDKLRTVRNIVEPEGMPTPVAAIPIQATRREAEVIDVSDDEDDLVLGPTSTITSRITTASGSRALPIRLRSQSLFSDTPYAHRLTARSSLERTGLARRQGKGKRL